MSLPTPESPTLDHTEEEQAAIKALVDSYAKTGLQDTPGHPSKPHEKLSSDPRPLRVYTREELLHLYNSPLVQLPPNMPELKQWFGDNEILLTKKESDSTSNSGRDRRFRRELEDGDASSRPSFRSTLSQPSQMGNFKHQSLRSGDRDRERDGDRDREIRDKEGLRHLSDKYDRDRLGVLSASARGKDRDSASHTNSNSSNRTSPQNQSTTSHRRDPRESQKKRSGEVGDDWRRNETSRTNRDDRDDRDRARSRGRESSRSRRSPSRPRREKDDGKDRLSRNDRDRDDFKRERDVDRDQDDDPRRWRDDGKREERIAARRAERDRELRTRERDRGDHWEPSSDRRWATADEKDSRHKRTSGRDRKPAGNGDEPRDRDERREREKEKEPAWMETYVPTSTTGILGGKSTTGELDGIQAWKKGLKEKELTLQEKDTAGDLKPPTGQDTSEKSLDEIQLFKLMMKREEEKKNSPTTPESGSEPKPAAMRIADAGEQTPAPIQSNSHFQTSPSTPGLDSSSISPKDLHHNSQSTSTSLPEILSGDNSSQAPERSGEYNPPAGSRFLALSGRPSAKSPVNPLTGSSTSPNGFAIEAMVKPGTPRTQGFSPLEEQMRREEHAQLLASGQIELNQRPLDKTMYPSAPSNPYDEANGLAYAGSKGSRFAKFFDNKTRENALPGYKPQTPTGFLSSSPNPLHRQEHLAYGGAPSTGPAERTMEDIFAMLNNSSQAQRASTLNHPTPHHPMNSGGPNHPNVMNGLPSQPQHLQPNNRLDALYDSRLDDRFVPDGMVPGLRTTLPPRNRDNVTLYQELPDEELQFHLQRLQQQQQQQRGLDPFAGPNSSMYVAQNGRGMGLPSHQAQFRGGPSPGVGPHNQLPNMQPQRLPPGLANLGGRPPHDPTQLLGLTGHPITLHPNLQPNIPHQQPYSNFAVGNNLNFSNPQLRGPIPNLHQMQGQNPHPSLAPMGLGANMELRSQNPNQIMNMGGPNLPGPRGNALFNPQQNLPGALLGGRQQQAQLPPQVPPHLMPPHYQPGLNGPNSGHTNELIALLMGGAQRE